MAVLTPKTLDSFLRLARSAGMPQDQVVNLYERGYVPFPKQILFHAAARECDKPDGPIKVGFGGARGPGKTTTTFAQMALDDCQRVPGLKCLFIRQTQKSAKESFEDLRLRLLRRTPHDHAGTTGILKFPNGSRIHLGGFANDKDIDKYLGLEYDLIAIEEDTQLSASKKQQLLTCLRTSKRNWRPRSYHTTNPGGVDHAGYKKTFIEPFRKGTQTATRFIPSFASDNPALNAEYLDTLNNLTGWLRGAWLDGDWDIAAGQFFTTWRYEEHTCEPFPIPDNADVWAALDYGFTHPTVACLAFKHDGTYYIAAEHCRAKALPPTHAEAIKAMLARKGVTLDRLKAFYAGADVFQMKGDAQGKKISQQYQECGIRLRPAVDDRIAGAAKLLQLLGDKDNNIPSKFKIFRDCPYLIEQIPAMIHDQRRPEDVLKVDVDEAGNGGDDGYDCVRYAVASEGGVGVYI